MALLLCQAKGEHFSLVSKERLYSQAGVCDNFQGNNSLVFCFLLQFQKGGDADKCRVYTSPRSGFHFLTYSDLINKKGELKLSMLIFRSHCKSINHL